MKVTLKSKRPEIKGVFTFIFEPEEPVSWQPGQYMHYVLGQQHPDDRGEERWFTIAAAPFEKHIQITTRFDGEKRSTFKQALLDMEPGGQIESDGPKGSFILQPGDIKHVLIAGGIGITPYRSMLAQMNHDNNVADIDLLYANRDEDFVFDEELEAIAAAHPSFRIVKFIDKHIEAADLEKYLSDQSAVFYLSGPRPMVESYEGLLKSLNIPEERIKTDYFPGY
jgi:ferredoxin-NADP reductase